MEHLIDILLQYGDFGLGTVVLGLLEALRQCHKERRRRAKEDARRMQELECRLRMAQQTWIKHMEKTEGRMHEILLMAFQGGGGGN